MGVEVQGDKAVFTKPFVEKNPGMDEEEAKIKVYLGKYCVICY